MTADRTALPQPASTALEELAGADAAARLFQCDATLFSDSPDVQATVADRLGWLAVTTPPEPWPQQVRDLAQGARSSGLTRTVLCGMGGSSLAPEVFATVFDGPLVVLDSTHPDAVEAHLGGDLADALVVVSSKSGTTEETRAFGALAAQRVPSPDHLVAITDGGSELEQQARDGGWRTVLVNPSDIGGRYSALSLFGMAPAALAGVDADAVWASATRMAEACRAEDGPGAVLGAYLGGLARAGRDKLTLLAHPRLAPLGEWVEQLVAESTGKAGVGVVPVVGEPVGPPEVYGDDRAFVALSLAGEPVEGADALAAAGHPVLAIDVPEPADLGAELVRWEVATALAGVVLGVNPFDEPNVSESKAATRSVLEEVVGGGALPDPEHTVGDGALAELLRGLRPGDYLAVQAYLAPSDAARRPLEQLRRAVRDRARVATTFGWGPRFLHSTGQLHKGGPPTCVALQVVDAPTGGPSIPGRPYDFAQLVRAQALGDLRSLRAHDLRVVQVGIRGPEDLEALAGLVG